MDIPQLTHQAFFVLSLLIRHGELRAAEVVRRAEGIASVNELLRKLHRRGLVDKREATLRGRAPRETIFSATRHGRDAFQDQLDFYLCVAQGTGAEGGTRKAEGGKRTDRKRGATPAERERLLAVAPLEFAPLLATVWELADVSIDELAAADVGDFDAAAGRLTVGDGDCRRDVALSPEATEAVAQAAGARDDGPLFVPRKRRRWNVARASEAFRQLRKRAGVSADVGMRHRPDAQPVAIATRACARVKPVADVHVAGGRDCERLLGLANPPLARFLRAVWALPPATIDELAAADVGDFDPRTGELAVGRGERRRLIPVDGEAEGILREAAGDRRDGPLFVPLRARRFRQSRVAQEFYKLRRRAGLPANVVLRGQSWRRQRR